MPSALETQAARVGAARRRVRALSEAAGLARLDFAGLVEPRGPASLTDGRTAALAEAHGRRLALEAALAELARRALERWGAGEGDEWRAVAAEADPAALVGLDFARAAAARAARGMTTTTRSAAPDELAARTRAAAEAAAVADELLSAEGVPPKAERVAAEVERRRAARSAPVAA